MVEFITVLLCILSCSNEVYVVSRSIAFSKIIEFCFIEFEVLTDDSLVMKETKRL